MISKHDKPSFGTLNVIPLTSIKEGKFYHDDTINLDNEILNLLNSKLQKFINKTSIHNSTLKNLINENIYSQNSKMVEQLQLEINKMKPGSVALLNQITTISKQRIHNPKFSSDLLSGVHLSNSTLNLIDRKIIELFTK